MLGERMLRFVLFIILLFSLSKNTLSAEEKDITVWSYYNFPPFSYSPTRGLNHDLVELLNQYAKGEYRFKLAIVPRVKINQYIQNGRDGLVLFVNWNWMDDKSREKYFWSHPLLSDRNEIISLKENSIDYTSPESLIGYTFAAIRGRKYKGLDGLLEKKEIIPFFINGEKQAYRLLLAKRVHITSQPKSIALPLLKEMGIADKIHFSQKPLFSYTRHIMTTKGNRDVAIFLDKVLKDIDNNIHWKVILKKYGL